MIMREQTRNQWIDKLTGRSTSAGPITDMSSSWTVMAYVGGIGLSAADPANREVFSPAFGWSAAAGGVATLTTACSKASTVGTPSGTLTHVRLKNSTTNVFELGVGLSGSGADCILDNLVASAVNDKAITNLSLKLATIGSMQANDALLNAMLDCITGAGAAPNMGGSGLITVYDGTPPASVNDPATGTALCSFSTTTTSWNSASAGSAALAASLVDASADATGTATYARWTKGGFTIQGTAGVSGTTFLLASASIVASAAATLTGATISI